VAIKIFYIWKQFCHVRELRAKEEERQDFSLSLRNDSGGGVMAFALSGMTRFLAALGMTAGRHLGLRPIGNGEISRYRFEMTAGVASWPSPYREGRDFSLRSE